VASLLAKAFGVSFIVWLDLTLSLKSLRDALQECFEALGVFQLALHVLSLELSIRRFKLPTEQQKKDEQKYGNRQKAQQCFLKTLGVASREKSE
jgi:hypothetical protein